MNQSRHAKEQVGIDLSKSKSWFRFCEIYYDRPATEDIPSYTDVTVIFIADAVSAVPSMSEVFISSHPLLLGLISLLLVPCSMG